MRFSLPAAFVCATLSLGGPALAQTTVTGQPATGGANSAQSRGQEAVTRPNTDHMTRDGRANGSVANAQLEPGSNSFTEGQVRSRLEEAGFQNVTDLRKDDQGIWRGKATKGGAQVNVSLDFRGNVTTQ